MPFLNIESLSKSLTIFKYLASKVLYLLSDYANEKHLLHYSTFWHHYAVKGANKCFRKT
jgi:hypothetical protein